MTESAHRRARITGIGRYLPPEVRTNDWWPAEVVKSWARNASLSKPPSTEGLSATALQIITHMSTQGDDPFQGTVARHVMPAGMSITEMEVAAANDALARAGVDRGDIDLLLTHCVSPQSQLTNPAAILHHALGLRSECFAMHAESSAYSFLHQLAVVDAMFATGRARKALLVQSCAATRLVDPHSSVAPYFGDGATAVVVEASDRGVVTSVHFTDGRYPDTIVSSVPGGTWYDEGRPVLHVKNAMQMRSVLLQTVDLCKASIELALQRSGYAAKEVAFFCIHQGTPWLRRLAQEASGLGGARSVETFAKTGYLFSAIIPFGLRTAHDEGLLHDGDLVALFGGGTGMTYGATLLVWSAA
jgi:3-oxoacyl-[acyl-carrier-protein] synthase-3